MCDHVHCTLYLFTATEPTMPIENEEEKNGGYDLMFSTKIKSIIIWTLKKIVASFNICISISGELYT